MPRIDLVVAVWGLAGSWVDLGTDNCGTKYGHNAETNADRYGKLRAKIADKCEHAGINFFDMESFCTLDPRCPVHPRENSLSFFPLRTQAQVQ
eukprot:scaffold9618_cov41-Cyclotella_meneghiniana.AAC.2